MTLSKVDTKGARVITVNCFVCSWSCPATFSKMVAGMHEPFGVSGLRVKSELVNVQRELCGIDSSSAKWKQETDNTHYTSTSTRYPDTFFYLLNCVSCRFLNYSKLTRKLAGRRYISAKSCNCCQGRQRSYALNYWSLQYSWNSSPCQHFFL